MIGNCIDTKTWEFNHSELIELDKGFDFYAPQVYKDKVLTLDRSNTEQTEFMKKYGSIRSIEIDNLENIELFIDNSILEMYINNGEYTSTSRFFIDNKDKNITIKGEVEMEISEIGSIEFNYK